MTVAVIVGLVPTASASGSPTAAPTGPSVAEARAEVLRSEQRLADVTRARDEARARLDGLTASNADLVDQIADARADVRDRTVSAFVSSSPDETMLVLLGSDDMYEASARVNLVSHSATQSHDALDRYNAVKSKVDPRLVEMATELQQLEQDVLDADEAVLAARANEAEAERQLAQRQAEIELARALATAAAAATTTVATTAVPIIVRAESVPPDPAAADGTAPPVAPPPTTVPAPLPAVPAGGPSEGQWAALRKCESGGNYRAVSASGKYRGAYQFDYRTWAGLGGSGDPAAASPAEQDARARVLYSQRSWRPWPVCGRHLI